MRKYNLPGIRCFLAYFIIGNLGHMLNGDAGFDADQVFNGDFNEMFISAQFSSYGARLDLIRTICTAQALFSGVEEPLSENAQKRLVDGDWGTFQGLYTISTAPRSFPKAFIEVSPDGIIIQENVTRKEAFKKIQEDQRVNLPRMSGTIKEVKGFLDKNGLFSEAKYILEGFQSTQSSFENILRRGSSATSIPALKQSIRKHLTRWQGYLYEWFTFELRFYVMDIQRAIEAYRGDLGQAGIPETDSPVFLEAQRIVQKLDDLLNKKATISGSEFDQGMKLVNRFQKKCLPRFHNVTGHSAATQPPSIAPGKAVSEPRFISVGVLPGYAKSYIADISPDGTAVVGHCYGQGVGDQAFVWKDGKLRALGFLPGGSSSFANGVSAGGTVIVGFGKDSERMQRAFRWEDGVFDLLGNTRSAASAVSSDGKVVVGSVGGLGKKRSFLYKEGEMSILSTLGGAWSSPNGICSDGSVLVGSSKDSEKRQRAYRCQNGRMVDLGTLGGESSVAKRISADGSIVVGSSLNAQGKQRACRWINDKPTNLGTLGGPHSYARDVSADGTIAVGYSFTATGEKEAFIWDLEHGMRSLVKVLSDILPKGWKLEEADAISDDGQVIAGIGLSPEGRIEGWIVRLP